MDYRSFSTTNFISSISAIICSVILGLFICKAVYNAKSSDRFVTVKGLVERIEKADRGIWELKLEVSGNEFDKAYQQLIEKSQIMQGFLKDQGINQNEILVQAPDINDLYRYAHNKDNFPPQRYVMSVIILVESRNVDQLKKISFKCGEWTGTQGIVLARNEIKYYIDRFNELRPQLITDAIKNAQDMAKQFAIASNCKIGVIRKANQGVISLSDPNNSAENDYTQGINSIIKKIRVVTTIEFYLD